MIEIHSVQSTGQIGTVAKLAAEIWHQHYTPIIGNSQVDYMLERFQSETAIGGQIRQGHNYLLATLDGEACGYADVMFNEPGSAFLSKIYSAGEVRGHGVGTALLRHVEGMCVARYVHTLWLTVNRYNSDSIAWYERRGFAKADELVQDIGNGFVMDDFRMEKRLCEFISDRGE